MLAQYQNNLNIKNKFLFLQKLHQGLVSYFSPIPLNNSNTQCYLLQSPSSLVPS